MDVATGKAPVPVESEAEKAYLSFMSVYFLGVLATGLLLAGSVGVGRTRGSVGGTGLAGARTGRGRRQSVLTATVIPLKRSG